MLISIDCTISLMTLKLYVTLSFLLLILSTPVSFQDTLESKVVEGKLTEPCGILGFGGKEVGSFEMRTVERGTKTVLEFLKIEMKEPPESENYDVGIARFSKGVKLLNKEMVPVDEYESDPRVMIAKNRFLLPFAETLFVADGSSETHKGAALLWPSVESIPEPSQFKYKNATIEYMLGVEKREYMLGERIGIKPQLINLGNENLDIIHADPLFIMTAYSLDGRPAWVDQYPMLDIGIGATLEPETPYSWRIDQKRYDIRFCTPGEYTLVSYADYLVEEYKDGSSSHQSVKIYSEPVVIKVNPVPEVDSPPIVISKVELWGPAYFVEGVNTCGLGKSSISDALQWAEIRNTTNEQITTLPGWKITVTNTSRFTFEEGLTLPPKEACVVQTGGPISVSIAGPGGYAQPSGYNGSAVILEYSVKIDKSVVAYKDSTPELNDTYGDTRNWQLIDGEWVFKNGKLPDADRTTLTETTEDGSIIVNLIIAEEITAPTSSKFRVSFIDAPTQQLMKNVNYQIIFEGTSMPVNISSVPLALVSKDNPFKREWSADGIAENGTDTQIHEISSPGSLNIRIRILGINNEPLAQALDVKFSILASSGFPEPLQITEVELNSDDGGQWFELYNPTDRPINASKLVIKQLAGEWATARSETTLAVGFGKQNFTMKSVMLLPNEYRVFEISSDDDSTEERFLTSRSVLSLVINEREVSRTPELTDNDTDSRTWQLEGNQWVLAEATPSRAIPEFPVNLIVITAVGLMGVLIMLRTKGMVLFKD